MACHVRKYILVALQIYKLAGIAGSNTAGGMDVCCECCVNQVEVSATGRSLVQRSPTDCGV